MKKISALIVLALVAACSGEKKDAQPTGVNDVRRACDLRVSWNKRTTKDCTDCLAIAATPRCECYPNVNYSGACSDHRDGKLAEPICDGVDACVNTCDADDCACIDGCYAGKDACRPHGAALDGCLTQICEPYCR